MRVAIDTTYTQLGPSGTAVYIERLIAALADHDVEVVELRAPLRTRRGGASKLRSAASAAVDLTWTRELFPRAAARAEADVMHHPLPAWSPGGLPQVLTVHDVAYARRPEDFDPLWRRLAWRRHRAAVRRADAIVAVSQTAARDASAWFAAPPEKVVVAPHGPGQDLPPIPGRSADHFLYVGDDEPRKNVSALIEAHEEYMRRGGQAQLILAGAAGHRARWHGSAEDAGFLRTSASGDRARVVGYTRPEPETLAELHARSIALVHPSSDEGFGLTVLEAMAAGTPVLAVRNGAIEELTGGNAVLVGGPSELAEAMLDIENEVTRREELAQAARRRAEDFSWDASARAHIQAYTLARESR